MSIQISPIKQNNTMNFSGNVQQNPTNANLTPKQKVDEFVSNHKKQIIIGAGIAASIAAIATTVALVMKGKASCAVPEKAKEVVQNTVEEVDVDKIKSQLFKIESEFDRKKSAAQLTVGSKTGMFAYRKIICENAQNNNREVNMQLINSFLQKGKSLEKTLQEGDSLLAQYDKLSENYPEAIKRRPTLENRKLYDELIAQVKEIRLASKFDEKGQIVEFPSIEAIKKIFSDSQQ